LSIFTFIFRLTGLRNIFIHSGKRVDDESTKKNNKSNKKVGIRSAEIANILLDGRPFVAFVGKETTDIKDIFVWYVAEDHKLGTLYFTEGNSKAKVKPKNPEQALALHRISDAFLVLIQLFSIVNI
jgi:hypothetical protein